MSVIIRSKELASHMSVHLLMGFYKKVPNTPNPVLFGEVQNQIHLQE